MLNINIFLKEESSGVFLQRHGQRQAGGDLGRVCRDHRGLPAEGAAAGERGPRKCRDAAEVRGDAAWPGGGVMKFIFVTEDIYYLIEYWL